MSRETVNQETVNQETMSRETVNRETVNPQSTDPLSTTLTLFASAARLGALCWTERRLFEVLGGSVAALADPGAKLLVDRHAAHAAWRAEQWWARLPVLAVVDRDELVAPPPGGVAQVYEVLAGAERLGAPGRLAGLYRVALPRLAAAYRGHRALTSPVADGPVRRTLGQVEADIERDRAEGETFVHSLLVSGEAVDQAAASVARLERLLVA
jgi:hypothetical protein